MIQSKTSLHFLVILMIAIGLSHSACKPPHAEVPTSSGNLHSVTLHSDQPRQTIEGFGASITADSDVRQQIYQDPEFLDFLAYDLGASIMRMVIESKISTTPIENPENIDYADFELESQAGKIVKNSIRFAQEMQERQSDFRIIGTAWSAPGWMKQNGTTQGSTAGYLWDEGREHDLDNHLRDDRYEHYAKWLFEYTQLLKANDIPLFAISPQNELMFTQFFDSCLYTAEEYARIVRTLGKRFEKEGIQRPLIFGPEDMTFANYNTDRHRPYVDALMQDNTRPYFDVFATHGYTDGVEAGSTMDPAGYWEGIKHFGLPYWITEGGTGEHDWPIPITTGIGSFLHYALTQGNAGLFTAWQFVDPSPSSHGILHWNKPTKKTFTAMHYWRYIRPGFQRIETSQSPSSDALRVSAFKDTKNEKLVIVVINTHTEAQPLQLNLEGPMSVHKLHGFQTTESSNFRNIEPLTFEKSKAATILPPQSITTFATLIPVEKITLNKDHITTEVGLSEKLSATLHPTNATNQKINWKSSNPEIATVSATGDIIAHNVGTTQVTAYSADGSHEAKVSVTINPRTNWTFHQWNVDQGLLDTGPEFLGTLYNEYGSDWAYSYLLNKWIYFSETEHGDTHPWIGFYQNENSDETLNNSIYYLIDSTSNPSPQKQDTRANIALHKPITVSNESSTYEGVYLIDGDTNSSISRWSAETYPQSAHIDLQGMYEIDEFRFYPLEKRSYQYKIEVSQDGKNFTTIVDRTNNTEKRLFISDKPSEPIRARYVLLTITGAHDYKGTWISIGELEVFGTTAQIPATRIQVSHHDLNLGIEQEWQLKASVEPQYAYHKGITWTSKDSSIASIDKNGLVRAIAEGQTEIVVSIDEAEVSVPITINVSATNLYWANWKMNTNRQVDTGNLFGTIFVPNESNWIYLNQIQKWVYLPQEHARDPFVWIKINP